MKPIRNVAHSSVLAALVIVLLTMVAVLTPGAQPAAQAQDGAKVFLPFIQGPPPPPAPSTIPEVLRKAGNFTMLLAALKQAGLDATLSGSGPFTVFAPTDAAFQTLLTGNELTMEQLLQVKELPDILKYHVLPTKLLAAAITNGDQATTLEGKPVTFEINKGKIFVDGAQIVTADIPADNGVIHAINVVLLPPQ